MAQFIESNSLLGDPSALRKRLRDEGYLFLRDILPKHHVLDLRRQVLEICKDAGWLRSGSELMDGVTDHAPIREGEDAYSEVYARVQALEAFHRLKLDKNIMSVMEDIFQEPVFSFPQSIARIAFPKGQRARHPATPGLEFCWRLNGDDFLLGAPG